MKPQALCVYEVIVSLWMEKSAFDVFFFDRSFLVLTQSWFLKKAAAESIKNEYRTHNMAHNSQQSKASYNKDIKSEFQAKTQRRHLRPFFESINFN